IIGDTTLEANESFRIRITSPTVGAIVTKGFGFGTIINDDELANQPPTADADGPYAATEDALLMVNAANGVLNGDADPENGPVIAELVTPTAHGTLTFNPDGSFSYQPGADFDGTDSFIYRVRDAAGLTSADVT